MTSSRLYWVNVGMRLSPATRMWTVKRSLLRWANAHIENNARIVSSLRIQMTGFLSIGADLFIGHEVLIVGGNARVSIDARVDIAPQVTLVTGSHELAGADRAARPGYSKPINILDGVWIGASATILGGVTIGDCAVVAANSHINPDVPPCTIVAGVPAEVIKKLSANE